MADYIDYQAEQDALTRRQKLLAAMLQQAQQSQVVGTSNGLGQALAKLGTAYFATKGERELDKKTQESKAASHDDMTRGLEQYMQTYQGGQMAGDGMGPPTEADPRRAVFTALASQHPELKAIGAAGFKDMQPQVKEINGQVVRVPGVGSSEQPRVMGDFRSPQAVNNQLVAPGTMGDFRDKFGNVGPVAQGPNGQIFGQANQGTGEVKFAPPGTQINVDTKGEGAAMQAGGKALPEVLQGARDKTTAAIDRAQSADRIMSLAKDPEVMAGFAAQPQMFVASLAAKVGFTGPEGVSKTQSLLAEQAKQTLVASKDLKGSISEKEKPFLEEAAAGRITWTPETIQHLAGLSKAAAMNEIVNANKQVQSASQFPGGAEVAKLYPVPDFKIDMDPNLFDSDPATGRFSYKSQLNFAPQAKPAVPGGKGWSFTPLN